MPTKKQAKPAADAPLDIIPSEKWLRRLAEVKAAGVELNNQLEAYQALLLRGES